MSKAFDVPISSDPKSWAEQQETPSDSFAKREDGATITAPIEQIRGK